MGFLINLRKYSLNCPGTLHVFFKMYSNIHNLSIKIRVSTRLHFNAPFDLISLIFDQSGIEYP